MFNKIKRLNNSDFLMRLLKTGSIKMDLFEEWLENKESKLVQRVLTAQSYKNIDHSLEDKDTAFELATYGDALIKFCYAGIYLDNVTSYLKKLKNM